MTSIQRPISDEAWLASFAGYLAGLPVQITRSPDFRAWRTERGVVEVTDLSEDGERDATVRLDNDAHEARRRYPLTLDGSITAAIHAEVLLRYGTLPDD